MTKTSTITPMAKQEVFQIRIDGDLKRRIMLLAEQRGISAAALIISTMTAAYPELRGASTPGLADVMASLEALKGDDNRTNNR